MSTPNVNLPDMPSDSFQPSVPFNEAMQTIDALLPLAVQSMALTAPPATVAGDAGKRWIPATGATGAWSGHVGDVALCTGADLWVFIEPPPYIVAYNIATGTEFRNIAGTWTAVP